MQSCLVVRNPFFQPRQSMFEGLLLSGSAKTIEMGSQTCFVVQSLLPPFAVTLISLHIPRIYHGKQASRMFCRNSDPVASCPKQGLRRKRTNQQMHIKDGWIGYSPVIHHFVLTVLFQCLWTWGNMQPTLQGLRHTGPDAESSSQEAQLWDHIMRRLD